jgi:hypothetical protein
MTGNLVFRHAGVVLEVERRDRLAVFIAAADAGEGDDRADVLAGARQQFRFGRRVEWFALTADRHRHGLNLAPRGKLRHAQAHNKAFSGCSEPA